MSNLPKSELSSVTEVKLIYRVKRRPSSLLLNTWDMSKIELLEHEKSWSEQLKGERK